METASSQLNAGFVSLDRWNDHYYEDMLPFNGRLESYIESEDSRTYSQLAKCIGKSSQLQLIGFEKVGPYDKHPIVRSNQQRPSLTDRHCFDEAC